MTADHRPGRRQFRVEFEEVLLTWRNVVFREDGLNRALRFAKRAVDAFIGVDDEKVGPLVKAVHGAHLNAIGVFALDAVLGDDKGHGVIFST